MEAVKKAVPLFLTITLAIVAGSLLTAQIAKMKLMQPGTA